MTNVIVIIGLVLLLTVFWLIQKTGDHFAWISSLMLLLLIGVLAYGLS